MSTNSHSTDIFITDLGVYLKNLIPSGKLNLHDKNTIDYDKLLEEIYNFAKKTTRKDKELPGDRATAFRIACEKLISLIEHENQP